MMFPDRLMASGKAATTQILDIDRGEKSIRAALEQNPFIRAHILLR
jgi:hypothetical protein